MRGGKRGGGNGGGRGGNEEVEEEGGGSEKEGARNGRSKIFMEKRNGAVALPWSRGQKGT